MRKLIFRRAGSAAAGMLLGLFWPAVPSAVGQAPAILLDAATVKTAGARPQADFRARRSTGDFKPGQRLSARGTSPWLVQFRDVVQEDWKQALARTGARIKGYIPENAFLVEATPGQMAAVARLPEVAWAGEYLPAHKAARPVRTLLARNAPESGEFNVILFNPGDAAAVQAELARIPGVVVTRAAALADRGLVRVQCAAAALAQAAGWGEVEWIEPYVPPRLLNNVAVGSNRMNVARAWSELGLTGTNQIVAVCDTGLDNGNPVTLHPDLRGRLQWVQALGRTNRWDDLLAHGTHVCGSLLGNGTMSTGLYKGVACEARLVLQSVLDERGGMAGLPDDLNDLFQAAFTNGARIHSDSWGAATEGLYTTDSRNLDMFVWNNRAMLVVFAAGNDGEDFDWHAPSDGVIDLDSLSAPGTAKNCMTIGAAENFRTNGGFSAYSWGVGSWSNYFPLDPIYSDPISAPETPQGMAAFSSRGPCDDGRFKPDLVAPGTDVISVRSTKSTDTGWGVADNTNYLYMGGTSMATPLAAGAAALARQWLQEQAGLANPSAALLKALLMNGARDLAPGQYGTGPC